MIYVFNRDEQLLAILSNESKDSCPYWNADVKEVLGAEYTFTFTIPFDHMDSIHVQELGYVAFKYNERKWQLIIITQIEEIHGGEFVKEVFCEHASIELFDDFIESLVIDQDNVDLALPSILQGTRWEVGDIDLTSPQDLSVKYKSVREVLATFSEVWGVELAFHVAISGNQITNRYVDAVVKRGFDTGKRFEYRKDIEEVRRTILAENIKTALYGFGGNISAAQEEEEEKIDFANVEWSTEPTITNLLTENQSSVETNLTGLGVYVASATATLVQDSTVAKFGTKSAKATKTSTAVENISINNYASRTPIKSNTKYTFSAYFRVNELNKTGRIYAFFYNAAGTSVSSVSGSSYTLVQNGWVRVIISFTSPANISSVYFDCTLIGATNTTIFWVDGLQLEELDYASSWILGGTSRDGNHPISKPLGQKWVGLDSARLSYGRMLPTGQKSHRYGVFMANDVTDPKILLQATYEALLEASTPLIQYSCKVIDLMKILGLEGEAIHLGDTVRVIDTDLNLRVMARIIEYKFDLTMPEQSEVTLGNFQPTLTKDLESIVDRKIQDQNLSLPPDLVRQDDLIGVVRNGDMIPTSWLEGDISAAQNIINAGGGTVVMNEGEGILIVDDPLNPQKAIKLIAGTLALANERDPVTGLFNWRTFGTAEGFLADLVETGFLRFERSQGGVLTLGGSIIGYDLDGNPIYQNGQLQVIGQDGEKMVELAGDKGGFDELFVGTLRSDNVLLTNTKEYIAYYVNHQTGSDTNDGLSWSTAFATIQKAVDSIPKFNAFNIDIYVYNNNNLGITFNEPNLTITGILGPGHVGIMLGKKNIMNGEIWIEACQNEILITTDGTTVADADKATINNSNRTGYNGVVHVFKNTYAYIHYVKIYARNQAQYCTMAQSGYMKNTGIECYEAQLAAICGAYGAMVEIIDCKGLATRGVYGAYAAVIGGNGTAPKGSTVDKYVVYGASADGTWTFNAGLATPPAAPPTTSTWKANKVHSYNSITGWESGYAYQGVRPTDTAVIWYGVFFFDTAVFTNLKDGTTPRPIKRVRIKIKRTNNTGDNTRRYPRFYYSMQTSASGGAPGLIYSGGHVATQGFLWGQEYWVDLPIKFGEAFRDGQAKSLIIYDGTDTKDYMKFEGYATLEITHG